MGFFSAVKRFFGQKKEEPPVEAPAGQIAEPEQTAPQETPESQPETPVVQKSGPESGGERPEASTETRGGEAQPEEAVTAQEPIPPDDSRGQLETAPETDQAEDAKPLAESGAAEQPEEVPAAGEVNKAGDAALPTQEEARGQAKPVSGEEPPVQEAPEVLEEDSPTPVHEDVLDEVAAPDSQAPVQEEALAETAVEAAGEDAVEPAEKNPERDALILALRQAEPKLSNWLGIVLEGQEQVSPEFWARLRFLLEAVEAPPAEIDAFLADFGKWLERMEYNWVDEFRSELQYRLALALDLEDEEDERNRLLVKLSEGLAATRNQLGRKLDALFAAHGELSDSFWEEMEELFIMADMGYETAVDVVERLRGRAAKEGVKESAKVRQLLQDELEEIFKTEPRIRAVNPPEVILAMGVNGAGKTTTIAKLAYRERLNGKKVLVAAADTFRAAAIEQLQIWAERAGVDFYAKPAGSDPASVAWEAVDYALKNDIDTIFVDTAGRLQTRVNLMEELGKIRQVLAKKHPGAPHRNMLVLDATTGQNALSQAKLFREAAGVDEIVLTKLDGTARGGVAIAVAMQEKLPITFIGLGEKMEDLRPFNGRDFAGALLAEPVGN